MFSLERPDFEYFFRAASGRSCLLGNRELFQPFLVTPTQLIETWAPSNPLSATDLDVALALEPELIILGTGDTQVFPPAAVMAHCLSRRIGLEVMNNASAARTFNILAGEGRRVAAALLVG